MTVLEGPAAVAHYRMCQVIAGLSIQAKTGMVHSGGSMIKLAQRQYGIKGRTAKTALAEMKKLYFEKYGWEYGIAGTTTGQ